MASITDSQKILLEELIEYACDGSPILVKTPGLLFSARKHESYIIWIVIYREKKHSLISWLNEFNYVSELIFKFIHATDKELNNEGNS